MAIGAIALAKKEAIVSRLVAIEEMAGMDILCADKTGTITKNQLSIAEVKPFEGFKDDDVLLIATLASREEDQDPIDTAVIDKFKTNKELVEKRGTYKVPEFKPFDPVIKRTEATVTDPDGKKYKVSKGAPQAILALVKNKDIESKVNETVDDFAKKGHRPLGVAKTDEQEKWQYIGLLAFMSRDLPQ